MSSAAKKNVVSLPCPSSVSSATDETLEFAVEVGRLQRALKTAGFEQEAMLLSMALQTLEERLPGVHN